jgi:hypothetical protein
MCSGWGALGRMLGLAMLPHLQVVIVACGLVAWAAEGSAADEFLDRARG